MFLDDIKFDHKQARLLSYEYTRWDIFANEIYKADITEHQLLKLLQMELMFGQREMIISRLYSRFSKLRYYREKKLLFTKSEEPKGAELNLESWDKNVAVFKEGLQNEAFIVRLIRSEQEYKYRGYILNLLYGRLTSLRRTREHKEMKEWRVKKQQKSI